MTDTPYGKNLLMKHDGTEVEYAIPFGKGRIFAITASKYGVSFTDSPIFSQRSELDQFARTLAMAFKDYMSLARTGKPHEEPMPNNAMEGDANA